MDNRNKFWKGVMVGVLVTAFTCFVTVGASTAIYMFGQDVMGNQAGAGPGREEAGRNASPAGEGSGELDLERISEKLSQIGLTSYTCLRIRSNRIRGRQGFTRELSLA